MGQILAYHHRKEMDFMVEHTMTKETLKNRLTALCGKEISACSEKELYTGLLSLVQEMAKDKGLIRQ